MPVLVAGPIRLAVLDGAGNKLRTLYLPTPDMGGLELGWEEKDNTWDLLNGDPLTRSLGYLPVLTCKWSSYDERPEGRWPLGTANGQRPCLDDLLVILSGPTRTLRVATLTGGGFTCDKVQVRPYQRRSLIASGIQVTFRAAKVRSQRDLEVF